MCICAPSVVTCTTHTFQHCCWMHCVCSSVITPQWYHTCRALLIWPVHRHHIDHTQHVVEQFNSPMMCNLLCLLCPHMCDLMHNYCTHRSSHTTTTQCTIWLLHVVLTCSYLMGLSNLSGPHIVLQYIVTSHMLYCCVCNIYYVALAQAIIHNNCVNNCPDNTYIHG